jgi:hypothetical protein
MYPAILGKRLSPRTVPGCEKWSHCSKATQSWGRWWRWLGITRSEPKAIASIVQIPPKARPPIRFYVPNQMNSAGLEIRIPAVSTAGVRSSGSSRSECLCFTATSGMNLGWKTTLCCQRFLGQWTTVWALPDTGSSPCLRRDARVRDHSFWLCLGGVGKDNMPSDPDDIRSKKFIPYIFPELKIIELLQRHGFEDVGLSLEISGQVVRAQFMVAYLDS